MAEIKASMKIEGLAKLLSNFRTLPVNVQKNVLAASVSKGAAVIGKEAQARAPVLRMPDPRRTPGLLRRMIRWTRGVRRDSEASAFVTVRRPGKSSVRKFKEKSGAGDASLVDPWYWKFVEFEFGRANARAQPFLRPAFDTKKEAAAKAIAEDLAAGVEREAEKLARGG